MTARRIFLLYVILSAIAAQYYLSDTDTLFGYGTLVDSDSLFAATELLTVGLLAFLLGSYLSKGVFKTVGDVQPQEPKVPPRRPSGPLPLWQVAGIVGIAAIYVYMFSTSVLENGLPQNLGERVFENKFSAIFMIFLAYLGYSASLHRGTLILRAAILIISLSVVIVDSSRSGLIPLLGLLLGAFARRRLLSALLVAYVIFCGANYSITARLLDDRFGFDVLYSYLVPDTELMTQAVKIIVDYLLAFSILNFSYMSFIAMPEFTWRQLLVSINPLPSYFLDPDVMDSLVYEDRARAIGGPAELLAVGPGVFVLGFFLLGVLAAYADTVVKSRFRFIVLLMFLLATVIFFQYSLRTSSRMFMVMGLVVFLMRRNVKSIGGRQVLF